MTAEDRVLSGRAWEDFCDGLKAAGAQILRDTAPASPLDRAEGWRYLTRLLRVGLEMHLECADLDRPRFYRASDPVVKIGADNPDNVYSNCTVEGTRSYRIRGHRGRAAYLQIASKANRYDIDGTMASTGELMGGDLVFEPDGSFEIIASQRRHNGNWLPMTADSSMLIIRETFLDPADKEHHAGLTIEAIGDLPPLPPLSAEFLTQGLDKVAAFVNGTARTFAEWAERFEREAPNKLAPFDQRFFQQGGCAPDIYYIWGYWKLAPGEALRIDTRVPDCKYWNFQLCNWWMESLEYRYLPVWTNNGLATLNADGTLTIVIAAEDTGVGNWIDTTGHDNGIMLLRWVGASEHPIPACRVVKLSELRA